MAAHRRLVLVGECPSGSLDISHRPALALTGSSGRNLCRIAGWEWEAYLRRTDRRNLFLNAQPKWDAGAAMDRATEMLGQFDGRRVILLGAKVATAFAMASMPLYYWWGVRQPIARIPHPSGINRVWNDPNERARAREFLGELL